MQIKTLAEILAEEDKSDNNSQKKATKRTPIAKTKVGTSHVDKKLIEAKTIKSKNNKKLNNQKTKSVYNANKYQKSKTANSKRKAVSLDSKSSHISTPRHKANHNLTRIKSRDVTPPKPINIKELLAEIKSETESTGNSNESSVDNLTNKLHTALKTPEQKQAEINEIKANGRLRWLAFYYLSTREHSAQELKDKLLAKEQNPQKIDELLIEFNEKGYQSDMRTAFMLIREGIRKGRGRNRIKQDFYKRKIELPGNIDELIDIANTESAEFIEFSNNQVHNTHQTSESVNWLQLAVAARVKKYGEDIPIEPKDKAKQLRFLQYRGFNSEICFEALKHDLNSLSEKH